MLGFECYKTKTCITESEIIWENWKYLWFFWQHSEISKFFLNQLGSSGTGFQYLVNSRHFYHNSVKIRKVISVSVQFKLKSLVFLNLLLFENLIIPNYTRMHDKKEISLQWKCSFFIESLNIFEQHGSRLACIWSYTLFRNPNNHQKYLSLI